MTRPRLVLPLLALLTAGVWSVSSAEGQDAKTLRSMANAEPNQEKQVLLLCKAADLEPKNKEFHNDCTVARQALITSDKQALKTALDANDAGQAAKAKRYAKYVSSLDPETHRQAEQLLAKLNAPAEGPAAPPVAASTPQTPAGPSQGALLAQALTAYDNGNLQAARTSAQSVTDPAVKPAAGRIVADIDRYSGYVSAGQRHEQAKEYAAAATSYQSAFDVNSHVSSDDLAGKLQRMHQLAATPQTTAVVAKNDTPKPPAADNKPAKPAVEVSPDEKKKRLLDESAQAMSRNDLDTAGRKFKQVLDLDPNNADAKRGQAEIVAILGRDPARLEKTLREAITAFYSSHFEDAESRLNRYLGAEGGKKKGAAFFYLGATEATLSFLDDPSKKTSRLREAQDDFKQARSAKYEPLERYVSTRVLEVWKASGS